MAEEVDGNPEEADKPGILAGCSFICISYGNPGDVDAFYDVVELRTLRGGEKRWQG